MTHLNQINLKHSLQYLTQVLVTRKHLKDQMLLISIEAFIAFFILIISSNLHASTYVRNHEVKRGETLWGIANANNLKLNELLSANGIRANATIQPGQIIKLPSQNREANQVASSRFKNVATGNQFNTYIVQRGETLYRIAQNSGVAPAQIMAVNSLSNGDIYPGQKLVIPNSNNFKTAPAPKRYAKNLGFRNEINSQQELINIRREKNKFNTYQTGNNTYDIFVGNRYYATFNDNVNSTYTKRRDGIFYNKGSKVDYNYIKSLGYGEAIARALSFVSSNEGTASALNFYDGAGSFGFIQFTIKYGSFAEFVSLLKENDYIAYEKYLKKYGIVLEGTTLVVYAPEGYKGKLKLTGEAIIDYIIETKSLYGPLIELGENTKAAQVESAREQYMEPVLNSQLNLERIQSAVSINSLINSTIGTTAVTDLAVKLGVSGAKQELEKALNIHLSKVSNPFYSLKSMSNYQLVKLVADNTTNALVKRRMNKLLQQGNNHSLYI